MNLEAKEFKPRSNQTFSNETSRNMLENKRAPGTSFKTASLDLEKQCGETAFQTAPVTMQYRDRSLRVNALLDPCSDASFISKAAADELGL